MLQMKSTTLVHQILLKSYRVPTTGSSQSTGRPPPPLARASAGAQADLTAMHIPVARRRNKVNAMSSRIRRAAVDRSTIIDSPPTSCRTRFSPSPTIAASPRRKRGVVIMLGDTSGVRRFAPLLIDLMKRGVITHLAMNGSAAIHDYEVARFGATSEDVAAGLRDGTFGMADETGREMNAAFVQGMSASQGMGEALGRALVARSDRHRAVAAQSRIDLGSRSVHAALGRDHSPASSRQRRRDRRHQPPRFSPTGRVAARYRRRRRGAQPAVR
jgi:hypothetical protein